MINQFDIKEKYLCQYNTQMVEFANRLIYRSSLE